MGLMGHGVIETIGHGVMGRRGFSMRAGWARAHPRFRRNMKYNVLYIDRAPGLEYPPVLYLSVNNKACRNNDHSVTGRVHGIGKQACRIGLKKIVVSADRHLWKKNGADELIPCTKIQRVELPATSSDGPTTRQKHVVSLDISPESDGKRRLTQPKVNFPRHIIAGKQRSFQSSWYDTFSWLEYSVKEDAVFCFVCRHFAVKGIVCEDALLHGYSDWKHIGNMASKHENSNVHKLSLAVPRMGCGEEVAESQHFNNIGNFPELIKLLCLENKYFSSKLNNMPQNAKYTSNIIQNDILQATSSVITQYIVREIKSGSTVYSLIVDEARDEGLTEQMSICVRCLNNSEIKERFLGFMELDQLNAHTLANTINCFMNSVGLDLTNCVSQSFDGASVMSGALNGVQALIRHMATNPCPFTIGLLEAIYAFQSSSTLRHNVFMKSQTSSGLDKSNVPRHSDTRWVSKYKGIHFFHLYLNFVVKALEECSISAEKKEAAEAKEKKKVHVYEQNKSFTNCIMRPCKSPKTSFGNRQISTSSSSRKQTINVRLADYFVTESVGKGNVNTCTQDDITDKCRLSSRFFSIIDNILQEMEMAFLQNTDLVGAVSACDPTSEFFMNSAILGSLAEAYNTNNSALIRL
ncbi:hypothetical protein PR048_014062 [Dryococelus australis]|uniref:TTF-type domain-containing protein n=1 Tax=Dryococelus australis TaxID=614101 RepID=A0ABQ9HUV4_9NEOP|nr:hypothetical protein PR048_014062 [Dryococelus australis]